MQTLDLNAQEFRKLKRTGVLAPLSGNQDAFNLAECVHRYLRHVEQAVDSGKQRRELDLAKTRIHNAVATRTELLLGVLRGEMLFLEDIHRRWSEEGVVMKGRALAICSRVIMYIAGRARNELQELFRAEILAAVAQLKAFDPANYMRRGADYFIETGGNSTNGHKPVVRVRARRRPVKS